MVFLENLNRFILVILFINCLILTPLFTPFRQRLKLFHLNSDSLGIFSADQLFKTQIQDYIANRMVSIYFSKFLFRHNGYAYQLIKLFEYF